MKKWTAVLVAFCLIFSALPFARADFAPLYEEYMAKMAEGGPVRITLRPTIKTFLPFTAERVEPMNRILKNTKIELYMEESGGVSTTDFLLSLGAGQVAALRLTEDGTEKTLGGNVLQDTLLVSGNGESPMAALFDTLEYENTLSKLVGEIDWLLLPDTLAALANALLQTNAEGKNAKDTKSFQDIGKAAKRTAYTLSAEEADALLTAALETIDTPYLSDLARTVTITGDTVKLTRYFTKSDDELAQVWVFQGVIAGEERKCTLTWSYAVKEDTRKDSIQFAHTNAEGKDKKTFAANMNLGKTANENRLEIVTEYAYTFEKQKVQRGFTVNLVSNRKDNVERFFGQIAYSEAMGDLSAALKISPDLVTIAYENNDSALSGGIGLSLIENGIVTVDGQVAIEIMPGEPFEIDVGTHRQDIAAESFGATQEAVSKALTKNLLTCALSLNIQDLTLLTQFIPADALPSLVQAIPTPEN